GEFERDMSLARNKNPLNFVPRDGIEPPTRIFSPSREMGKTASTLGKRPEGGSRCITGASLGFEGRVMTSKTFSHRTPSPRSSRSRGATAEFGEMSARLAGWHAWSEFVSSLDVLAGRHTYACR